MPRDTFILHSTCRSLCFALLAVIALASCANAGDWHVEGIDRVVAITDVHGAYEAMVETLKNVGVIDEELRWAGGETYLLVTGDLVDRGPRSRDVMDFLMHLEGEAAAAGGRVHVLIGNHEAMNMTGDLRYVSKAEYAAFAGDETPAQRDRWLAAWARRNGVDPEAVRARFDSTFPAGYFALREAFGANGKYGEWLLGKDVIAVVNRTAFVHGGLSPLIGEIGLDGVNRVLTQELADYVAALGMLIEAEVLLPTDNFYDYGSILDNYLPPLDADQQLIDAVATLKRLGESRLFALDGPLWYRGNVACGEVIEEQRLARVLDVIGADRVVIGHTPTPNRRVLERFGGRIIEIDTGMLKAYYKGSGNALVLDGGELQVYNQSGAAPYVPYAHPRHVGRRPDHLSASALQKLLETGEIVAQDRDDATGRTVLRITDGTHTVSALFAKRRGRGFYPDVAAYRLDRLLGLDMVPVTVLRSVGKREGSVQFFPARASDEARRSTSGGGGGAQCPLPTQWEAMYVFDVLIHNEGRSQARMLYEPRDWSLILIEHQRAFGNAKGRPAHLVSARINVTAGWRAALSGLSNTVLAENFADVLDKRRLKALAARRDQLLAADAGPGDRRKQN